ncbi:hypothetical protein Pmani_001716 [Petrolisthes manimaculis]|uniref:Uncharacterized protein n=1 Tax=Petrolisthes manimaculis TaxID=1843537 RepID=A0AAE1URA3_9EUCA|nr:hypothetical protein Pmani_001716 [Petrolisthes manimaculis]
MKARLPPHLSTPVLPLPHTPAPPPTLPSSTAGGPTITSLRSNRRKYQEKLSPLYLPQIACEMRLSRIILSTLLHHRLVKDNPSYSETSNLLPGRSTTRGLQRR